MHNLIPAITIIAALLIIAYISFWPFKIAILRLVGTPIVSVKLSTGKTVSMTRKANLLTYKGHVYRLMPSGAVTGLAGGQIGSLT